MLKVIITTLSASLLMGCGGGTICYKLDSWGPTTSLGETANISPAKCHMQYLNEVWVSGGNYWLSIPENDSHMTYRANPLPTQSTWEFRSTLIAENNGGVAFYNRNYSCDPNDEFFHLCNVTFGQKECVAPLTNTLSNSGGCLIEAIATAPNQTEVDG